jgi:hypothetical protein
MMFMMIYTIFLFVLLTPSILVRLPKKGNKYTVAFVHGTIFAIIYHFTHTYIKKMFYKENFSYNRESIDNMYTDSSNNMFMDPSNNMYMGPTSNIMTYDAEYNM